MSVNTKINLSDDRAYQNSGQTMTLSGNTVISNSGNLNYATHPTFTDNTQIVDKKYVDDLIVVATGESTIYNLASPATVTVGGISSGYVLTGKTSNCLLKEILTPYQAPSFSSFSVSTLSTPVEVGTSISGSQTFAWAFSNSNISANTMCIIDVTASNTIATNISTTSPQAATIGSKTFTTCNETQQWKGCAKNSCGTSLGSSNTTITALLPYYYGKCTCPGAAGANRPSTLTPAEITGGTKVLAAAGSSFAINFNSTADDYLWFAIPVVAAKTCWSIDALNNGSIGGGISAACNLFPTPVSVGSVSNNCWNGQTYCVYISNKQTSATSSMTIS